MWVQMTKILTELIYHPYAIGQIPIVLYHESWSRMKYADITVGWIHTPIKKHTPLGDKILNRSIMKLFNCIEEPHGNDTRATLTVEECYALLAFLDKGRVAEVEERMFRNAHGNNPVFIPRMFSGLQQAANKYISRVASVEHCKQDDIRRREGER